jgi:hypothetical protein
MATGRAPAQPVRVCWRFCPFPFALASRAAQRGPRYFSHKWWRRGRAGSTRKESIAGAGLIEIIHWTLALALAELRPQQQKG